MAEAKQHILIVEDEPVTALALELSLIYEGYRVTVAPDAFHALARARREHVDAVITDLHMPAMDGYELIRRLRADRPTLPILVVTGIPSDAQRHDAEEMRTAVVTIRKPAAADEVLASLSTLLRSSV